METNRDASIVKTLVDIADNLVDDFDVVELLTELTHRCVNLLGISAAGVMLAWPPDELRLVASSSEAMQLVELFELQANEGPCMDAFRTGERVEHERLGDGTGPWPRFSEVALAAGFRSVSALPLRLRDATIGALNLFSVEELPMDEDNALVARGFADLATISILQHGASNEAQRINEQLSSALASRVLIEQAKGVIAERAGIEITEAFTRLRSYARSHSLLLADVAQAAIDGTLDPRGWSSPAPTNPPAVPPSV
jgi:transcriptional regulator with GAF, ATPase, and Fis domain